MLENNNSIMINGKKYALKITLGFWKRCGFSRDKADVIANDPEAYTKAIKLALFYGNKEDYAWSNLEDMAKVITDEMIDSLDEDYTDTLSKCMVHYMPPKLRKITLQRIRIAEEKAEKMLEKELNGDTEPLDIVEEQVEFDSGATCGEAVCGEEKKS